MAYRDTMGGLEIPHMTDFIPKHTPEQQSFHNKNQAAIDKVSDTIAKARNEWTDRIMQAILPDALYVMAKGKNGRDRMKVQRWMAVNKVRLKEWPDRTEIVRDGEIMGRFFVTFKDKKLEIDASIRKGLRSTPARAQSCESAKENSGSVLPPTDAQTKGPDTGGVS